MDSVWEKVMDAEKKWEFKHRFVELVLMHDPPIQDASPNTIICGGQEFRHDHKEQEACWTWCPSGSTPKDPNRMLLGSNNPSFRLVAEFRFLVAAGR